MLHSQVLHTSTSQRKQVSPTYSGWGSHSPEIACCCCWQNEEWHNEMSAGLLSVSQAHGVKHWVCPSVLALFSCFGSHLFHFSCQFLDVFSSSFPDFFSLSIISFFFYRFVASKISHNKFWLFLHCLFFVILFLLLYWPIFVSLPCVFVTVS